jgi:hypothetical protein
MMKMLVMSRMKLRSLSRMDFVVGAVAVSGSTAYLFIVESGTLLKIEGLMLMQASLILCGIGLVVGSLALCWSAIVNYRWTTHMHEQITEALAGEAAMFEKLIGLE